MVTCSFSGRQIPKGKGKMYVRKDGRIYYFDSSKSMKNFLDLKRKPRETKWTADAHKAKQENLRSVQHEQEAAKQSTKTTTKKQK